MNETLQKLADIFRRMVDNCNDMGKMWKNIPLGKEAFGMMESLPDTLPGEYETPAGKASLLACMLEQMDETATPRFAIRVRQAIRRLDPSDSHNLSELEKLRDFINPDLPMEDYCRRHHRHLKFDPVERTPRWEEIIYDVERQTDAQLADTPRGMGFCFGYWAGKAAVLRSYGIDWRSPSAMNPRVMFD